MPGRNRRWSPPPRSQSGEWRWCRIRMSIFGLLRETCLPLQLRISSHVGGPGICLMSPSAL